MKTSVQGSDLSVLAITAGAAVASSAATYWFVKQRNAQRKCMCSEYTCSLASDIAAQHGIAMAPAVPADPFNARPRPGYLSWDDYFMAVAFLSSQRSKDPHKQVGACIVDAQNVISGIGYNGFPRGCPDSKLPWAKAAASGDPLDTKYPYVCHAEMNALLNKNGASVTGARIYVTMFPCNECAKLMIQAGISEVVYHEDKEEGAGTGGTNPGAISRRQQYRASRKLMDMSGVKTRQHHFKRSVLLHIRPDP